VDALTIADDLVSRALGQAGSGEFYREGLSAREKQHYELRKKIWRIAIEEHYVIGAVGLAPGIMGLRVVKNSVGNVSQRMLNGPSSLHPKQSKPETAFYKR
jgi:hypothetical protein